MSPATGLVVVLVAPRSLSVPPSASIRTTTTAATATAPASRPSQAALGRRRGRGPVVVGSIEDRLDATRTGGDPPRPRAVPCSPVADERRPTVAFLGAGTMGSAMARN